MSAHRDDVTLCCQLCREEYIALGFTDEARDRAAAEGPTCCTPKTTPEAATVSVGEPASGAFLAPLTRPDWLVLIATYIAVFGSMAAWCWLVVAR